MIAYFTSDSQPFRNILACAKSFALEKGSGSSVLIEAPGNLTAKEQLVWAETEILRRHETYKGYIVVASTYELPLLRILRRIREANNAECNVASSGWITGADLMT